jgi:mutual gliding-motility protein MglA
VRKEKTLLSLENLKENLATYNKDIFELPLVLQYNKRDLAEQGIPILPVETLDQELNSELKAPVFEASAVTGTGVIETFKKVTAMTIISLKNELR